MAIVGLGYPAGSNHDVQLPEQTGGASKEQGREGHLSHGRLNSMPE